jgi:hypothetical protein
MFSYPKLLAFSFLLFFSSVFFVPQAYGEIEGQELSDQFQAQPEEMIKCGTELCYKSKNEVCFEAKKCYTKVTATSEDECKRLGGGSAYLSDIKYIKDNGCFLTGNALQKYNETPSLLGYKLTTELKPPTLNFRILDLTFADISKSIDSEGYLHIPWLGQYITAVYKFALGVVSIVAVIMLILQGLTVLMSGGGEEKMAAYKKIAQIMIGLVIAWSSYAILYNINPNLVEFKAFKVKFIAEKDMDSAIYDKTIDGESGGGELKTATPKPEIEKVFNAYASCFDIDPKILTAIATAESSLNSNAGQGKKYQGLFQESKTYCSDGLKAGKYPSTLGLSCSNILNAEVNTAAAVATISYQLKKILDTKNCPAVKPSEAIVLLYIGHNNGPGVQSYVLKNKGCDLTSMEKYVSSYYDSNGGNKNGVSTARGIEKFKYGIKVGKLAETLGVKEVIVKNSNKNSLCPINTGKKVLP